MSSVASRGRSRLYPRLAVLLGLPLLFACGGPTEPGVDQAEGMLMTWGRIGLQYDHLNGQDDDLLRNFLRTLGEGQTAVRMLYTLDCDPRTDPNVCFLVSNSSDLDRFYEIIAEFGTIDYASPLDVALADYDIVLASYCDSEMLDNAAAVADVLNADLLNGGRHLVMAQNFCLGTVDAANLLTQPWGLTFADQDPSTPTFWDVPPAEQTGLLENVDSLYMRRAAPQTITNDVQAAIEAPTGILSAYRTFPVGG